MLTNIGNMSMALYVQTQRRQLTRNCGRSVWRMLGWSSWEMIVRGNGNVPQALGRSELPTLKRAAPPTGTSTSQAFIHI